MPEYVWHFNVDISHYKIPVCLFIFIATQIAFSIPEIHFGKQLKFWMGTSLQTVPLSDTDYTTHFWNFSLVVSDTPGQ